jgi:hypothetical protein
VYPEFDAWLNEAASIVRRLLLDTPVDPARRDLGGLSDLLAFAWKHRKIGDRFYRLVDLMTMSADDFLSQWFEHSVTRAVLGYYCSIGTFAGPKDPGIRLRGPPPHHGRARGRGRLGLHPRRHGRHQRGHRRVRPAPRHGSAHRTRR